MPLWERLLRGMPLGRGQGWRAATPVPRCVWSVLPAIGLPVPWAGGPVGGHETEEPPANRRCGPARLPPATVPHQQPVVQKPSAGVGGSPRHSSVWKGEERGQPAPSASRPLHRLRTTQSAPSPVRPPTPSLPPGTCSHRLRQPQRQPRTGCCCLGLGSGAPAL